MVVMVFALPEAFTIGANVEVGNVVNERFKIFHHKVRLIVCIVAVTVSDKLVDLFNQPFVRFGEVASLWSKSGDVWVVD